MELQQLSHNQLSRLELVVERMIYERSFYEFFKVAFCQLHPGKELDDNWHIKYLCDILQEETFRIVRREKKIKDIIINIPPRSLKSYITSVCWPVWSWVIDPSLKFATISYSEVIALHLSRQSKNLIQTTWFQRLYGKRVILKSDVSGAGHYETTDTGVRKAVGMTGSITGMGFDALLFDDPLSPKQAFSEAERETAWFQFNETFYNRLNEAVVGLRVTIMQRLSEMDQTGRLMDPKTGNPNDHLYICIPAEYDETTVHPPELKEFYKDGLFSVNTFPRELLENYKKRGGLFYAGQYQQRPVPPEGNLFKKAWFEILTADSIQRDSIESPIHFFIDTAFTADTSERNDPSGILTVFKKDNFMYVVNFVEVWLEFPDLIEFIKQYVVLNGYTHHSAIYVEPKASGKSVVQQLKGTQLNVIEVAGEWIRDDKVTRASGVSPIAQSGKVKIIEGPWNDKYLTQLTSFPKAAHDEAVDTTVYALNYLMPISDFFAAFI